VPASNDHARLARLSAPPRNIRSIPRQVRRKATMLMRQHRPPPMAYTSESEFAAAIAPYSYGVSTTGVKKSVVTISA
jgi:hypothetical protein